MRRALLCLVLLLGVAGCSWRDEGAVEVATEPAGNLDCLYPLVWDDRYYEPAVDVPDSSKLEEHLAPGVILGCGSPEMGYYPDDGTEVRRVEGIHPSVAVAAQVYDSTQWAVFAAPGYLIESPRHPLHEALAETWGYTRPHPGRRCDETLRTRARSLATPDLGQPLEVVAVDPAVEDLLVAPGGNRSVSIDPETDLIGLDRNGVPYVGKNDDLMLVLNVCVDEDDPVPSEPFLVAESVRKL
ncbi:MAG TPA: hypothetical protein VFG85_06600 [Gaiellaceae bacterium]|nr:hypothetical protein [Gaiellaceae bacterium]